MIRGKDFLKTLNPKEFDYKQDIKGQDKYLLINKKTGVLTWIWGQSIYSKQQIERLLKQLRGES